jgi:hypothetical protein
MVDRAVFLQKAHLLDVEEKGALLGYRRWCKVRQDVYTERPGLFFYVAE